MIEAPSKRAVYIATDEEKIVAIVKTMNDALGIYQLQYEAKLFLVALNSLGYDLHKDTSILETKLK